MVNVPKMDAGEDGAVLKVLMQIRDEVLKQAKARGDNDIDWWPGADVHQVVVSMAGLPGLVDPGLMRAVAESLERLWKKDLVLRTICKTVPSPKGIPTPVNGYSYKPK